MNFIYIVFIILLVFAVVMEIMDRYAIVDIPSCRYIKSYCNDYGQHNNIKYVIKEPINNTESIDLLLDRITQQSKFSDIIHWRISLIISLIICFIYWLYNQLSNSIVSPQSYMFLFFILWFLNYWMRNYLDYHYYEHKHARIVESIQQIKNKLYTNIEYDKLTY